ncbi:MAG: hypothetical protein ACK5CA_04580 [Cyanobacteriota bacterium]|jgi:hypothetical protein
MGHKLKSFEHEREVRAIYWKRNPGNSNPELLSEYPPGILAPIDINSTIENIIISPVAPRWFLELTDSVTKKYGITVPVSQSSLSLLPYE